MGKRKAFVAIAVGMLLLASGCRQDDHTGHDMRATSPAPQIGK